jgi:hypothetical protein
MPYRQLITHAEAQRTICVDYEGSKDRAPTLLGWSIDGRPTGWIVEPCFHTCAGRWGASRTTPADHAPELGRLLERAEHEDRLVISWTQHDLRLMQLALAADARRLTILDARYRDAKATATRWWWTKHGEAPPSGALSAYLQKLRFHVPIHYGPGRVGDHLRALRPRLEAGDTWATLHPRLRERWREVVRHNEYDLEGLRFVALKASQQMEENR